MALRFFVLHDQTFSEQCFVKLTNGCQTLYMAKLYGNMFQFVYANFLNKIEMS